MLALLLGVAAASLRVRPPLLPSKTFRGYFFFRQIFGKFAAKFLRILCKFSQNFLKDSNLGITHCKIVEIVRNSGKDPLKFEENLQNLLSSVKIRKNSPNFAKNCAKA